MERGKVFLRNFCYEKGKTEILFTDLESIETKRNKEVLLNK